MNRNHVIAVFDQEYHMVEALQMLVAEKQKVENVYMPYPVHEVFDLLKIKSRFTTAAFFYGLFGALGTLAFLYYTAVISWPLNFGGKPSATFPSFIVVTLILTILIVTIASLGTFSWRAKIFPGKRADCIHIRATDDKFIVVLPANTLILKPQLEARLNACNATDIIKPKS